MANLLSSVPLEVSVGFVIGADIIPTPLPRSPWEVLPTGTGARGDGANLSYGTEARRSWVETEDWRGLDFLRPNNESMGGEERSFGSWGR